MADAPDPKVTTGWTVQNQGASGHELLLVTSEGTGEGGGPAAPTTAALAAYADAAVAGELSRAETAEGLKLVKTANLSDLANSTTARGNLGLGTAATHATGDYDAAGVAAGLVAGVPLHSATIQNVYGVTDVAGLIAALVTAGIVTNTA
jgi:hypothetical protein